jgi:predicted DNA-binding protein with PD1-like motif
VPIGVHRSTQSRHLLLRVSAGEIIPDALATALRAEQVTCGWLRGSGVLADVELRSYDAQLGALSNARRIDGPVHVLSLDGSIGVSEGEVSLSLRALLSRETDSGLEALSGEIGIARTVALEVFVTSLDDLALQRSLDDAAGVWLLGPLPEGGQARQPAAKSAPTAWSGALDASDRADRDPRPRGAPTQPGPAGTAMPARPPRPAHANSEIDVPFPEPGDAVDHFAFGPCDILKSDGDRLHLKVHKGGRVREIALGMLRVTRLPDAEDGRRRFKLERRM